MSNRACAFALLAALVVGCSSATTTDTPTTELNALAPLKKTYEGIVAGFDLPTDTTTLVVSLDVQGYADQGDYEENALRRDVAAHWCKVWSASHPGKHAMLRVNFGDFRGQTVATETKRC